MASKLPAQLPKQFISMEHLAKLELYEEEKPFYLAQVVELDGEEASNLEYELHHKIPVYDVRNSENKFTLDANSFTYVKHSTTVNFDIASTDTTVLYMREMVQFTRQLFNAERVICYDIRQRLNTPMSREQKVSNDRSLPAPVVTAAHIDHTRDGGFHRVKRHLTEDEEEEYLTGRYRIRIVNLWRPLFRAIEDAPLALCDSRTVSEEDLVAADRVSPLYAGEIYYVWPNEKQCWYWMSRQTPDEVAVFLSFDSAHVEAATPPNTCAHASFSNPLAPVNAPPRESVEVRMIVFTLI